MSVRVLSSLFQTEIGMVGRVEKAASQPVSRQKLEPEAPCARFSSAGSD